MTTSCASCSRPDVGPKLEVLVRPGKAPRRGPPLLFVHGGWHDAHCWDEHFMPYFAELGYDCHALSLRGHGASEGRERMRFHRLEDFVHDLCAVASALPGPPVIVAHSLGSCVAAHYLARHRAAAAMLLTPVPPQGLWSVTGRFLVRHPLRFLRTNLTWRGRDMINDPAVAKDFLFSDSMPDEEVRRHLEHIDDEAYLVFLDTLFRRTPKPPTEPLDVLVIGAERDRLISAKDNRRTAAHFGADLVEVPGIAHDVMLEASWRSVAEIVRARIARLDDSNSS